MVDVNLKVPAIEKLLDYTASGIGAVAGPMLATWKARRDGEARRIAARATADARLIESAADAGSLQTIAEAQIAARRSLAAGLEADAATVDISESGIRQRLEFQEEKRQRNIVSVVRGAARNLEDTAVADGNLKDQAVADREPDPDWTARFFGAVQDVSSVEMQEIWAKILSGEVQEPGRSSLRTLDVLKNMSRNDAMLFESVASFVIDGFIFYPREDKDQEQITYGNLLHLQNCGLVNIGSFLAMKVNLQSTERGWIGIYQDTVLRIQETSPGIATNPIEVPCAVLTAAGRELLHVTRRRFRSDYLRRFAGFLRGKNCRLSHSRIVKKLPSGQVQFLERFDPIDAGSGDTEEANR